MLTRLKVSCFKNLVDVDVRFGPFTCIAGANGVGKSNLFDAIQFLSALADHTLLEAALSVRGEGEKTAHIRQLFHRVGDHYASSMSFEAEMIIPPTGIDDLGQETQTTVTLLRYSVTLGYRQPGALNPVSPLELLKEELISINPATAEKHLLFSHSQEWQKSILNGYEPQVVPFISSEGEGENRLIKLHHQNGFSQKRLKNLPRTVLSVANSCDNPTLLLARREMQSWHLLHLEPSALRQPAPFTAPTQLGSNGAYLAKMLYYLAGANPLLTEEQVYGQISHHLFELIGGIHKVRVERNEIQELFTIEVAGHDGAFYPAMALSEGTLRFLTFATLEQDWEGGLWCIEEPENGIHPQQIEALIGVLEYLAMDTTYPLDVDNPLRQVIINTHSPSLVASVPDDSLLIAESNETIHHTGQNFKQVSFGCFPNSWRTQTSEDVPIVMKGELLAYLNPIVRQPSEEKDEYEAQFPKCLVREREDLQILIPGSTQ
jgi:predicted ATPase